VVPLEQMVADGLEHAGIKAIPQPMVSDGRRRCRPDFAIQCRGGAIAIECDNVASHQSPAQRLRDGDKDAFLRRLSWTVVRLPEREIVSDLPNCIARVRAEVQNLGGPTPPH
jgi:very-short-patch-repair endonuclease